MKAIPGQNYGQKRRIDMPRRGENIRKRKDGRWEGRYRKAYKMDGKAIYGSVYGKTYLETKRKLLEVKGKLQSQPPPEKSPDISLGKLLDLWLDARRIQLKEQTYVKYRKIIDKHIVPLIGDIPAKKANQAVLNDFLLEKTKNGRLDQAGGLSPNYVRTIAFIAKSALEYGARAGYCMRENGEIVMPHRQKSNPEVLTAEEQAQLERNTAEEASDKKLGILLSLYMGLRVGEVCGVTWGDIDFDNATLHIHHTVERISVLNSGDEAKTKLILTDVKTEASDRIIPIPSKLLPLLKNHRKADHIFVLQGSAHPYTDPRSLQYFFRKYLEDCRIRSVNYHVLRHTFATRCMESGMDVKSLSEILGHSNVNITLDTYVHSSLNHKRKQLEAMTVIYGQ